MVCEMRLIDADKLTKDLIENKSFYPAIVKNAIENMMADEILKELNAAGFTFTE